MSGVAPFIPITTTTALDSSSPSSPVKTMQQNSLKRARAVYDYDAKDASELSLMCDEVI